MLTLVPEAIERYAVAHSAPLDPLLEELVATTRREFGGLAAMLCGPIEGLLLQTLVAMSGARRVLEIGTFTGFSALLMAAALPDDGELITCEVNPRHLAVARAFFARSPHGHKITVREGPALATLRTLAGPFDLVFIDADKEAYPAYYEAVLPLLAPRGVIVVDNVLRGGRVLAPESAGDRAMVAFNAHVARDPRVRPLLLPLRDGVLLIRRT
jgi:caffeoyl-CoA O-methyltransferase